MEVRNLKRVWAWVWVWVWIWIWVGWRMKWRLVGGWMSGGRGLLFVSFWVNYGSLRGWIFGIGDEVLFWVVWGLLFIYL